jgi:small subunit ribosomal protein S20
MANEGAEAKKGPKKRPTSQKRLLQNDKLRLSNKAARTRIKTSIKSFCGMLTEKKFEEGKKLLPEIYSLVDKATKKKIFKLNKASRLKSQLTEKLQQAQK